MRAQLLHFFFVTLRIWKFRLLSDAVRVSGTPQRYQPVLFKGKGRIVFGNDVQLGVIASQGYYTAYHYIESRNPESRVNIGDRVSINNNFCLVAFGSITIGNDVLIGANCNIMDSDAHHLQPEMRNAKQPPSKAVVIGNNVFIGDNVTILKGVTVGDNAVLGSAAVVSRDVPSGAIVAGNPAQVIRMLT